MKIEMYLVGIHKHAPEVVIGSEVAARYVKEREERKDPERRSRKIWRVWIETTQEIQEVL